MKKQTNNQTTNAMNGAGTMKIKTWAMMTAALLGLSTAMAGGKGTSGAQFLRIGAGARGPAIAAFSPIADDATAIYWNPAGMASVEKREVSLSYNAYFKDSASQFAGYAHPTADHGTFGVGASMFGVRNIEQRSAEGGDADSADMGHFNTSDLSIALGWAKKVAMMDGLQVGGAIKFIQSDLKTKSAATGAVDMGAQYRLHPDAGLSFSLAVLNLGAGLKFDSESDPLPLSIKPGVAYKMDVGRMGKLTAAMDVDMLVHDGVAIAEPGLEWAINPAMALRAGYQFNRSDGAGSGMSVGAGFNVRNVMFDYAFVPFGDLGDTHRASIGYKF